MQIDNLSRNILRCIDRVSRWSKRIQLSRPTTGQADLVLGPAVGGIPIPMPAIIAANTHRACDAAVQACTPVLKMEPRTSLALIAAKLAKIYLSI